MYHYLSGTLEEEIKNGERRINALEEKGYSQSEELIMWHQLKRKKEILDIFWNMEVDEVKIMLILRYRKKLSWSKVSKEMHVTKATLKFWNQKLKEVLVVYLAH